METGFTRKTGSTTLAKHGIFMGTELVSGTQIDSDAGSRSTSTESTSFALGGYDIGYDPGIGRNTSVLPYPNFEW